MKKELIFNSVIGLCSLAVFLCGNARACEPNSPFPYEAAGMCWSNNQGKYYNDGHIVDGKVQPGKVINFWGNEIVIAANICDNLGGHLPTYEEFKTLESAWPAMSDAQKSLFLHEQLWSSSVFLKDANCAFVFNGEVGGVDNHYAYEVGNLKDDVRCVSGRFGEIASITELEELNANKNLQKEPKWPQHHAPTPRGETKCSL